MKPTESITNLKSLVANINCWEPVEKFKDNKGNVYPVTFFNISFKEGTACLFKFAVDNLKFDIFVSPSNDTTLHFGVKFIGESDWFVSNDLCECIKFAKEYFADYKDEKSE